MTTTERRRRPSLLLPGRGRQRQRFLVIAPHEERNFSIFVTEQFAAHIASSLPHHIVTLMGEE